jgi:GTPase SAR1 family protein
MPRTIRILLLGDEDVGKSAFISSIIKQRLAKF